MLAGTVLTSVRSPRVQAVRRLDRRAARVEHGRFVVEGPQAVREALPDLLELFADAAGAARHPELLAAAPCRVTYVSPEVMGAMAGTVAPQGLLGTAALLDVPLELALADRPTLVAVFDRVADPGNAGTVLRTADAAGAGAVVLTEGSTDPHGSKCVRASAGSLWHLPVVHGAPLAATVDVLHEAGLTVLATTRGTGRSGQDTEDARDIDDLDDLLDAGELAGPTAWLFGNEASGLSQQALELADRRVAIELAGRAESLNLATAAALCLFASARAHRRRRAG